MKEYILTVTTAAIAAALTELIAPKEWEKYIRIIIGFLILSVILSPVAKFKDVRLSPLTDSYEISDTPLKDSISEALRQNIESDIQQRLKSEFHIDAKAVAEVDIDDEHNIKGVRAIEVKARKNPDGMIERLKEIYGCEKIELKFE